MMTNLYSGWSLQDADKKGLATITDDVKVLAGKARSNTLKPNDYEVCHMEPKVSSDAYMIFWSLWNPQSMHE